MSGVKMVEDEKFNMECTCLGVDYIAHVLQKQYDECMEEREKQFNRNYHDPLSMQHTLGKIIMVKLISDELGVELK